MALKKLVGQDLEYWIDREKISAIHEVPLLAYETQSNPPKPRTRFIVDGQEIVVFIHIENAMNWFNSTD